MVTESGDSMELMVVVDGEAGWGIIRYKYG